MVGDSEQDEDRPTAEELGMHRIEPGDGSEISPEEQEAFKEFIAKAENHGFTHG